MKITNNKNLPKPFFMAITQKSYSGEGEKKDYSVTELLKPAKIVLLQQRHRDELTQDASDMIWSFLGEMAHLVMEKTLSADEFKDNYLTENRYKITFQDRIISGGIDLYDKINKEITDYKLTSAWTVKFGGREEWEQQLNIYAYILRKHGYEVNKLTICAIFRDWQSKMTGIKDYPQTNVLPIDFRVWSDFEVECFMNDKIYKIEKYKDVPDDEIPICSAEDRWAKDEFWGVFANNGGKCYKKGVTKIECEEWLESKAYKNNCNIRKIEAESKRCQNYCQVKQFCNFGRTLTTTESEE